MRKPIRWAGFAFGALASVAILLVGVLYAVGSSKLGRTYQVETALLQVLDDPASIERGAHLSRIHGCIDCHGEQLAGTVFIDEPPFRLVASNLTPGRGGVGQLYSATDFDRAIRHGVRPDGSPLLVMPSAAYHRLSNEDAADLIAYLRHLPPVDNELPAREVRLLGRVLSAFAIDPSFEVRTERVATRPAPDGAYLASITCAYCHGDGLRGGVSPTPGSPPAPDLAPAGQWARDDFFRALRTGVAPDGRRLDPQFMPWTFTQHMTDDELSALHEHLRSIGEQQ